MTRALRSRLAPLLCVLTLASSAAASDGLPDAEHVVIPGTKLRLLLPDGFEVADRFAGILHDETGASVLLSEIPVPSAETRAAMTAEQLSQGGLSVQRVEVVDVHGLEATLVHASQLSMGTPYRKWLLVFGDDSTTVSLVAMVPATHEDRMRDVLLSVIRTAVWDPNRSIDPFEGLAFSVQETERLHVTERVSSMVFLSRPRDGRPISQGDPLFIVGIAVDDGDPSDLAELARRKLREITEVEQIVFTGEKGVTLDGLQAWETVAEAVEGQSRTPLAVYQILARDGAGGVILMQGLVGAAQAERYLPEFRKVAASFARKPPGPADGSPSGPDPASGRSSGPPSPP